ncbi:MAG: ABC transporter permease [Nitrososphaerota archaeon]|nr:ABC transporter permease [Nitrososphaerota archaeon]
MSLVALGFRNSFRRPVRTSLSILGVALCITLMLTVAAASQRYTAIVTQSYSLYDSQVVVVSRTSLLVEGVPLGGAIPEGAVSLLRAVNGVSSATPILLVVDVRQLVPTNITIGVPIENFSMFSRSTPIRLQGTYPTSSDQVVLGNYIAGKLNATVGSTIRVGGTGLTVSGIISTPNLILGNAVIMPLATAQLTQGYAGLVSAVLVNSHTLGPSALIQNIDAAIPGVTAIDPARTQSLTTPLISSLGTLNYSVDLFSMFVAFLFIAIISSVNILEQRDEFLTMKAIGSSTASVLKVTLAETGLMATAGVLLGLLLSAVATVGVFYLYASIPLVPSFVTAFEVTPVSRLLAAALAVIGLGMLSGGVATASVLRESK